MKLVRVEIPFHENATNKDHEIGNEIKLPEDTIERLRKINSNMVTILGEVEEPQVEETSEVEEPRMDETPQKKAKPRNSKAKQ